MSSMQKVKTWSAAVGVSVLVATMGLLPTPAQASTTAFDKGMQSILKDYLKVQKSLAADSTTGVQSAAASIAAQAAKLDASTVTGEHATHYKSVPGKLRLAAGNLAKAKNIEAARKVMKELSKPMAMWGTMSKPAGVDVVFCPMAKASWLQPAGDVKNPYHGSSMLSCGELVGGARHSADGHGH